MKTVQVGSQLSYLVGLINAHGFPRLSCLINERSFGDVHRDDLRGAIYVWGRSAGLEYERICDVMGDMNGDNSNHVSGLL